jgi:hypothetical protein
MYSSIRLINGLRLSLGKSCRILIGSLDMGRLPLMAREVLRKVTVTIVVLLTKDCPLLTLPNWPTLQKSNVPLFLKRMLSVRSEITRSHF